MTPQEKGLSAPGTVLEGGSIEILVGSDAAELSVVVPGLLDVKIPVIDGRAELQLPPNIHGGETIFISDEKYPYPSSVEVLVVNSSSR